MLDTQERHWRQVPKVNVLPAQGRTLQRNLILRVLLALIIIVGLYLVWNQRGVEGDLRESGEGKSNQLRKFQRDLVSKQQRLVALQDQINQVQEERGARERAFQLLTGNNLDWYTAFQGLFEAQSIGIIFQSVTTDPDGKLSIQGQTTPDVSLSSLPSQFTSLSGMLDFQSFQSDPGSDPPSFSATFRVRQ